MPADRTISLLDLIHAAREFAERMGHNNLAQWLTKHADEPCPAAIAQAIGTDTESTLDYVDVVFDGPPSHVSGRFVECETPADVGVKAGEWIDRGDGYWALRIPWTVERVVATLRRYADLLDRDDALERAAEEAVKHWSGHGYTEDTAMAMLNLRSVLAQRAKERA